MPAVVSAAELMPGTVRQPATWAVVSATTGRWTGRGSGRCQAAHRPRCFRARRSRVSIAPIWVVFRPATQLRAGQRARLDRRQTANWSVPMAASSYAVPGTQAAGAHGHRSASPAATAWWSPPQLRRVHAGELLGVQGVWSCPRLATCWLPRAATWSGGQRAHLVGAQGVELVGADRADRRGAQRAQVAGPDGGELVSAHGPQLGRVQGRDPRNSARRCPEWSSRPPAWWRGWPPGWWSVRRPGRWSAPGSDPCPARARPRWSGPAGRRSRWRDLGRTQARHLHAGERTHWVPTTPTSWSVPRAAIWALPRARRPVVPRAKTSAVSRRRPGWVVIAASWALFKAPNWLVPKALSGVVPRLLT